jgi:hypothetical protein
VEEQNLHQPEHLLERSWDEELRKWIPTKQPVVYHFGNTPDQLQIWLDDYDALSCFRNGRYYLDIFSVCTASESQSRWQRINEVDNKLPVNEQDSTELLLVDKPGGNTSPFQAVLSARWLQLLVLSLMVHYLFYVLLLNN